MRGVLLLGVLVAAAGAQELTSAPDFPWPAGPDTLRCQVIPISPRLNFGLRIQAGFTIGVPLNQYRGAGHTWRVWLRIAPSSGDHPATYLQSRFSVPPVPQTQYWGEVGGGFLVGDGHYSVSVLLQDDSGRICRGEWPMNVDFGKAAPGAATALPPGTVTELSWRPAVTRTQPVFKRLTVLLHATPGSGSVDNLRPEDVERWLGEVASLLDQAPATKVRFIIFNLEQQRELFRDEDFQLDRLKNAAEAIYNLQLLTVDYRVLRKPEGDIDLLTEIVKHEVSAAEPSDAVIFVGSHRSSPNRVLRGSIDLSRLSGQKYFYVRYRLAPRIPLRAIAGSAEMPSTRGAAQRDVGAPPADQPLARRGHYPDDLSASLVSMLRGTTLDVYSPKDFAKAVRRIAGRK